MTSAPQTGRSEAPVSVLVVDNHEVVREGVRASLEARPHRYRFAGAHADLAQLPYGEASPDVVVLDLYLGRDNTKSSEAIPRLMRWGAAVVLHTAEESPVPLREAVTLGAAGVSLKNDGTAALLDVIDEVARGDFGCSSVLAHALVTDPALAPRLAPREVEVLSGIGDGLTRQQIGKRLGISEETVRSYVKLVRRKYLEAGRDVTNASSLVREATRDGYLES